MTLDPQSKYPMNRSYVLKLHRDSHPLRDAMAGWLENMATGAQPARLPAGSDPSRFCRRASCAKTTCGRSMPTSNE